MCRMAAADGITHQVATPHANDRYHYDRAYLQTLVAHQRLTNLRHTHRRSVAGSGNRPGSLQ